MGAVSYWIKERLLLRSLSVLDNLNLKRFFFFFFLLGNAYS
jgi:hypothetical protein